MKVEPVDEGDDRMRGGDEGRMRVMLVPSERTSDQRTRGTSDPARRQLQQQQQVSRADEGGKRAAHLP